MAHPPLKISIKQKSLKIMKKSKSVDPLHGQPLLIVSFKFLFRGVLFWHPPEVNRVTKCQISRTSQSTNHMMYEI